MDQHDGRQKPLEALASDSGTRFFSVAPKIGNSIPKLTTAVLIASRFGKSKSEFQLLELMATFNKA